MILQSNEIISQYSDLPLCKAYHATRAPFRREALRHCHSAFEMALIASGCGVYDVGGVRYDFSPGDVFLFSTNEAHCITEVHEGAELRVINLQFEPRFIWAPGADDFDLRYLDVFLRRSDAFRHQLLHDDPRSDAVRSLLTAIDGEFRRRGAHYEMMVKNLLLTALVHVLRDYREYFADSPRPRQAKMIHRLSGVMRYADEHLAEELSLEQLAEMAHMSRSHFSALFREMNGLSVWEYVVGKRVASAAQLLRATDLPVMEIASACGFNTAANFIHAFRRHTGKTPLQYRKDSHA